MFLLDYIISYGLAGFWILGLIPIWMFWYRCGLCIVSLFSFLFLFNFGSVTVYVLLRKKNRSDGESLFHKREKCKIN